MNFTLGQPFLSGTIIFGILHTLKYYLSWAYTDSALAWSFFVSIDSAFGETITGSTAISICLVETKSSQFALVTPLANHQWLTSTVPRLLLTLPWPTHCSFGVARTLRTSLRIALRHIIKSLFASVAVISFHIKLTSAHASTFVAFVQERRRCSRSGAVTWGATIRRKAVVSLRTLIAFSSNYTLFAGALSWYWIAGIYAPSCRSKWITVTCFTAQRILSRQAPVSSLTCIAFGTCVLDSSTGSFNVTGATNFVKFRE